MKTNIFNCKCKIIAIKVGKGDHAATLQIANISYALRLCIIGTPLFAPTCFLRREWDTVGGLQISASVS